MPARRRRVRERVLQVLYACELSKEEPDRMIGHLLGDLKEDVVGYTFARDLIHRVAETTDKLDTLIRGQVEHWEFSRLAVIDKIILRMAICEFLYFDDIPPKVSMNEAIEIAREFSTEKSDKFVNGVLDSVLDDLKKTSGFTKTGRGLLDTSTHRKKRG